MEWLYDKLCSFLFYFLFSFYCGWKKYNAIQYSDDWETFLKTSMYHTHILMWFFLKLSRYNQSKPKMIQSSKSWNITSDIKCIVTFTL